MGDINYSDMMLYTYLAERPTARYWKNVASNIIVRMVLNNYILYKANYMKHGKLHEAWQTEIQVQLHCVHNHKFGGGMVGAEGQR
jgi:hypothetical protein